MAREGLPLPLRHARQIGQPPIDDRMPGERHPHQPPVLLGRHGLGGQPAAGERPLVHQGEAVSRRALPERNALDPQGSPHPREGVVQLPEQLGTGRGQQVAGAALQHALQRFARAARLAALLTLLHP
ncbi:MAG: hypothetical protein QM767_18365 [Anaeromyxobacter sp.]